MLKKGLAVLLICAVLVLGIGLGIFFARDAFQAKSAEDDYLAREDLNYEVQPVEEDLWPQRGEVIAVIDGREYRYDPIYLFRLTGDIFGEDPFESAYYDGDNWYIDYKKRSEMFTPVHGSLVGESQSYGKLAVFLELLALEYERENLSREDLAEIELPGKWFENREEEYDFRTSIRGQSEEAHDDAPTEEQRDDYLTMMKRARFSEDQTDIEYLHDERLVPYIEKDENITAISGKYFADALKENLSAPEYERIVATTDHFRHGSEELADGVWTYLAEKYNVENINLAI